MRVGIIAEGRGDLAVLRNLLKGWCGIDAEDVQFLVPEYDTDQTDLHMMDEAQRSNWLRVRDECRQAERIREFLAQHADDDPVVVVQIDTAEADELGFDVVRPDRASPEFATMLRTRVRVQIDAWLPPEVVGQVRHAIAVEETDAWVLTQWETKDTAAFPRPKERLERFLNSPQSPVYRERRRFFQLREFPRYDSLTKGFRRRNTLADCATRNASLRAFLDELCPPDAPG